MFVKSGRTNVAGGFSYGCHRPEPPTRNVITCNDTGDKGYDQSQPHILSIENQEVDLATAIHSCLNHESAAVGLTHGRLGSNGSERGSSRTNQIDPDIGLRLCAIGLWEKRGGKSLGHAWRFQKGLAAWIKYPNIDLTVLPGARLPFHFLFEHAEIIRLVLQKKAKDVDLVRQKLIIFPVQTGYQPPVEKARGACDQGES